MGLCSECWYKRPCPECYRNEHGVQFLCYYESRWLKKEKTRSCKHFLKIKKDGE